MSTNDMKRRNTNYPGETLKQQRASGELEINGVKRF